MLSASIAQVTALNPPGKLTVNFKSSGQSPTALVTVLCDYVDKLRIRQKPMPQIGTWGIVLFPYGDIRNGVWLGSYAPSFMDAFTATGANGQPNSNGTDPFIDYESHFSGHWWLRDGSGNYAEEWPDGSTFTVGYSAVPVTYRHDVDAGQNQTTVPFTTAQRIPNPPATLPFTFEHESGTAITVDTSGNVTVSVGNCSIAVDSTGVNITGSTGNLAVSGNVSAGNGVTGSFTTPTGQTVMVQDGIVTNIY